MQSQYQLHWTTLCCIFGYLKWAPRICPSCHLNTEGYSDVDWASDTLDCCSTLCCTSIGGNLMTSKKYIMLLINNAEAEYKIMAYTVCKLMWIQSLLCDMGAIYNRSMVMYCDN